MKQLIFLLLLFTFISCADTTQRDALQVKFDHLVVSAQTKLKLAKELTGDAEQRVKELNAVDVETIENEMRKKVKKHLKYAESINVALERIERADSEISKIEQRLMDDLQGVSVKQQEEVLNDYIQEMEKMNETVQERRTSLTRYIKASKNDFPN